MGKINEYYPIHVISIPKDQSSLTVDQIYLDKDFFETESSDNLNSSVSTAKSQSGNPLGEAQSSGGSHPNSLGRGFSDKADPSNRLSPFPLAPKLKASLQRTLLPLLNAALDGIKAPGEIMKLAKEGKAVISALDDVSMKRLRLPLEAFDNLINLGQAQRVLYLLFEFFN